MKKRLLNILFLISYAVPYAFLSMNEDATKGTLWFYLIMIISFGLLCFFSLKRKQYTIILIGNIFSFITSFACVKLFQTEKWDWYFEPFYGETMLIFITVIAFSIQIIWMMTHYKKQKNKNI